MSFRILTLDDQFILTAHRIATGQIGAVVGRSDGQRRFPFQPLVQKIGARGDLDQDLGPPPGGLGLRAAVGVADVFTDRELSIKRPPWADLKFQIGFIKGLIIIVS
jgi:hypothetical protein